MEIELEWCYTLLVSEATASPISLDKSKRFGCQILVKVAINTRQDKRSYSALASQTPNQTPNPFLIPFNIKQSPGVAGEGLQARQFR